MKLGRILLKSNRKKIEIHIAVLHVYCCDTKHRLKFSKTKHGVQFKVSPMTVVIVKFEQKWYNR